MNLYKTSLLLFIGIVTFSCSDTTVTTGQKEVIIVEDTIVPSQFTKNVLIEDFTGTWCGNCTRVALAIERVREISDKSVVVAVHNGNDPYHFAGVEPLRALIYPNSPDFPLPTARLNRTTIWTSLEQNNIQQAIDLTGSNCGVGLAMSSAITGNIINLDVKVKAGTDYSNLRLVVYLLEDNLVHYQVNYLGTYQGGVNPIQGYEHDHVLRASLTNILGEPVDDLVTGETYTRNFTIPVPANVYDISNINFVAFVVDSNNATVNSRAAEANEDQQFQENE